MHSLTPALPALSQRRDTTAHVQPDLFSATQSPAPDVWRINIEGVEYSFSLRKSARARNVILKVGDGGGLEVVVPRRMHLDGLDRVIRGKSAWILRHAEPSPETGPVEITGGTPMTYLGHVYTLRVVPVKKGAPDVEISGPEMLVSAKGSTPGELRDILYGWYRQAAAAHIKRRVAELGEGLRFGTVRIKDMNTRWGSCSPKGNLNFSWRLIAAPESVIDYLIVHELMHLLRPDHSKGFWRLVENRCPDYKKRRKWLSEHGRGLGRPL